jgi:hypothetical protein
LPFSFITLISLCVTATADLIENPESIPVGQSLTVNPQDTLSIGPTSIHPAGASISIRGTLINQGQVNALKNGSSGGNIYVQGILSNSGNIFADGALSITGDKIINQAGGNIILSGYMDMYNNNAYFENAGRMSVIGALGHRVYPGGFTAGVLRGTIKNTGTFILDRDNVSNICLNYERAVLINEGVFEVKKGSTCDFGAAQAGGDTWTEYRQTKGETIVDGIFGAHKITLQGGTLSGTGTILNMPSINSSARLNVSPGTTGSPFGTLTLIPESHNGYVDFSRGTITIELGGLYPAHDQLHVEGEFILGNVKINVSLRDGFVPKAGDSFTLLSANSVTDFGVPIESRLDLPALPSGLSWQAVNDGITVKLNVQ